ncbi:MAG: TonB family protein [Oceanicaulis sp.]
MVRLVSMLAVFALASALGQAYAQDLPAEVTDPYIAYTEALEAGDLDAAREAARQAWRAGERLKIDLQTVGVLADNFAQLALQAGEHGAARSAFERSAEVQTAQGGDRVLLAETWLLAARAARSGGDPRDAADLAERGAEIAEAAEGLAARGVAFEARQFQALALLDLGRSRAAIRAAEQAVDHLPDDGPYPGSAWPAAFISGFGASLDRDTLEAAYWMSVTHRLLLEHQPEHPDVLRTRYWTRWARQNLEEGEGAALLARLAERGLLPPEGTDSARLTASEAAAEDALNRDARPLRRTPPEYPGDAARAGLEGFALLTFDVAPDGTTQNVRVIASVPHPVFGERSARSVRRWRYEPRLVDGEPALREGVITEFNFSLEG